jgi:hypothetical protein
MVSPGRRAAYESCKLAARIATGSRGRGKATAARGVQANNSVDRSYMSIGPPDHNAHELLASAGSRAAYTPLTIRLMEESST